MIGSLDAGERLGYVDILASNGHMRWLQLGNDTLPVEWKGWKRNLADFATVYPILETGTLLGEDRGDIDHSGWLTCRQCRRKEKTPLALSPFYHATKLTAKWSEAIILENRRTGGYPEFNPSGMEPINTEFPIITREWRRSTESSPLVNQFFVSGAKPYSKENLLQTARMGDKLLHHYGALHTTLRAVQEPKMEEQANLAENASRHLAGDPDLMLDVMDLHRIGAEPRYRGMSTGDFRVHGFPHNPADQEFILTKLRTYVQEGKMFLCTGEGAPIHSQFIVSPSTTVAKKLPDRTPSSDKRVILDVRRVNLKRPKTDYWQVLTPTLDDLARRYCHLRTSAPGLEIVGTKRDIDAAFTRVRLHPDAAVLFGAEFRLNADNGENLIFFYLVLPFGFTGSPGIFGRLMQAVQFFHRCHIPPNPEWNGRERLSAELYVDDGMFLEVRMGDRPQISVGNWELGVRLFLGQTGISKKKLDIEGQWATELVLLGFHVNLHTNLISLPNPKITGAYNLINTRVLNYGNCVVSTHDIQELRGCINHWPNTGRIWKWLIPPANRLLTYGDSAGLWVRCNDLDKWTAFWNVVQFIRDIVGCEDNWPRLFSGVFTECIGVVRELTLPDTEREIQWFSGDATPSCIGDQLAKP